MTMHVRTLITVGDHEWTSDTRTPRDPDDSIPTGGVIRDGLTIDRGLPDSNLWPVAPTPASAKLEIIVSEAVELVDVEIGTPVAIEAYLPADAATPTETFYGRVADVQAAPSPLGTVYTLTCVDYLGDLLEEVVWSGARTSAFLTSGSFDSFFTGFGMTPPAMPALGFPTDRRNLSPALGDRLAPLDFIDRFLASNPQSWSGVRGRYVLAPVITDGLLDPTTPWQLVPSYRDLPAGHPSYSDPPDPDDPAVIAAAFVETSNAYALRKYDAVKRIDLTYTRWESSSPDPGESVRTVSSALSGWTVATAIESTLHLIVGSGAVAPADVATFYLVTETSRARYSADTLRWRLHDDEPGRYLPDLGDYCAVDGIAARWNPNGNTWLVGRLNSYTLTLTGTRPVVDLTLRDPGS